jgi:hypothetical protein
MIFAASPSGIEPWRMLFTICSVSSIVTAHVLALIVPFARTTATYQLAEVLR